MQFQDIYYLSGLVCVNVWLMLYVSFRVFRDW
jgi:hypothetical protein